MIEEPATICPRCNSALVAVLREFANGTTHIANLCTNKTCHRKYESKGYRYFVPFGENRNSYLSRDDLARLHDQGSSFGVTLLPFGPTVEGPVFEELEGQGGLFDDC